MSKTYDKYITPVISNMDDNARNHLMYRFSTIYRLNPQSMFRMKTKEKKEDIIRSFYWCVTQMYSIQREPDVTVIANAGQGAVVTKLVEQVSSLPFGSVDILLDKFTELAKNSKVYSSYEAPQLPQKKFIGRVWNTGHKLHR